MSSLKNRLLRKFSKRGAMAVLSRSLRRWLGVHLCGIYLKPLNTAVDAIAETADFSCRLFGQAEGAELIALTRRPELELSERFIDAALAKGDVCAAILNQDEVVGSVWFAHTATHDSEGVHIGFPEDCLYRYKAFVLPAFRGRKLPVLFNTLTDRYCRARGARHTIAYIDLHNLRSISAMTAQGGERIGFAGYLKWGPVFWTFRTPGVQKYGFHFFLPRPNAPSETGYVPATPVDGT